MFRNVSKMIVPATTIAILALTTSLTSTPAFAHGGGHAGGHVGAHGVYGARFGFRGYGHYRHGYFGYRNYGWGCYGSYCQPVDTCCADVTSVYPVCASTVCEAPVYEYPVVTGDCGSYWGGYRGRSGWGFRGHHGEFHGHVAMGGHGHGHR